MFQRVNEQPITLEALYQLITNERRRHLQRDPRDNIHIHLQGYNYLTSLKKDLVKLMVVFLLRSEEGQENQIYQNFMSLFHKQKEMGIQKDQMAKELFDFLKSRNKSVGPLFESSLDIEDRNEINKFILEIAERELHPDQLELELEIRWHDLLDGISDEEFNSPYLVKKPEFSEEFREVRGWIHMPIFPNSPKPYLAEQDKANVKENPAYQVNAILAQLSKALRYISNPAFKIKYDHELSLWKQNDFILAAIDLRAEVDQLRVSTEDPKTKVLLMYAALKDTTRRLSGRRESIHEFQDYELWEVINEFIDFLEKKYPNLLEVNNLAEDQNMLPQEMSATFANLTQNLSESPAEDQTDAVDFHETSKASSIDWLKHQRTSDSHLEILRTQEKLLRKNKKTVPAADALTAIIEALDKQSKAFYALPHQTKIERYQEHENKMNGILKLGLDAPALQNCGKKKRLFKNFMTVAGSAGIGLIYLKATQDKRGTFWYRHPDPLKALKDFKEALSDENQLKPTLPSSPTPS